MKDRDALTPAVNTFRARDEESFKAANLPAHELLRNLPCVIHGRNARPPRFINWPWPGATPGPGLCSKKRLASGLEEGPRFYD